MELFAAQQIRCKRQPFYILLNDEGEPLGPSYAFNESVPDYIKFLENGLKVFKQQEKNK
jgi:hypothetical protein